MGRRACAQCHKPRFKHGRKKVTADDLETLGDCFLGGPLLATSRIRIPCKHGRVFWTVEVLDHFTRAVLEWWKKPGSRS